MSLLRRLLRDFRRWRRRRRIRAAAKRLAQLRREQGDRA